MVVYVLAQRQTGDLSSVDPAFAGICSSALRNPEKAQVEVNGWFTEEIAASPKKKSYLTG